MDRYTGEYDDYLGRTNFSPRSTVAYKFNETSQFSVAYGWFFQNPSDNYLIYTDKLDYERADHYLLSYQLLMKGRTLRAEVYYKDYRNLAKQGDGELYLPETYNNSGSGYADCKTGDDFRVLGNQFERIAQAESEQWLPLYYHANSNIIAAFMEPDPAKKGAILDIAKKSVNRMIALAPDMEVVTRLESVRDAVFFLLGKPDLGLIFSDIQLADGLSFEIYQQVKVNCPIIFTTAWGHYVIEAFNTNGIDYLLKPIEEERLLKAIEKARQFLPRPFLEKILAMSSAKPIQSYKSRFLVKIGDKIKSIPVEEIIVARERVQTFKERLDR